MRVITTFLSGIGILCAFAFQIAATDCPHTSEWWTQLSGHVMETLTIGDIDSCYRACAAKPGCQSINYYKDKSLCELNSRTIEDVPLMRVANEDSVYFTIPDPLPPKPVHGKFSEWSNWTTCSLPCGNGTRYRNRSCTNPPPAYGGKNCTGAYSETQNCNTQPCPVDGHFTFWTKWTPCSLSCGNGTRYRNRSCTNPRPAHGGKNCTGANKETESCNIQPCCVALGIQNKTIISDYRITASTNNWDTKWARLNGPMGWYCRPPCDSHWLQINVGKIAKITGIATQGTGHRSWKSSWTEKYSLSYSNAIRFANYSDGQPFEGNTDRDTIVYHDLKPAIKARYVRIHPIMKGIRSGVGLRVELYECKEGQGVCSYALGMQSRLIKDNQITASSAIDSSYAPSKGRLMNILPWLPQFNDTNPWIQIDLAKIKMINGIVTQRFTGLLADWIVKEYRLQYRNVTAKPFINYSVDGVTAVKFKGNSERKITAYNVIDPAIIAQIVRILPTPWTIGRPMTMRVELYGCPYMGSYDESK